MCVCVCVCVLAHLALDGEGESDACQFVAGTLHNTPKQQSPLSLSHTHTHSLVAVLTPGLGV